MRLKRSINLPAFLAVVIAAAALLVVSLKRIEIDTDITPVLPANGPVMSAGIPIFEQNPLKNRIAIDIGLTETDVERLQAVADTVEDRLARSGLFSQVGTPPIQEGLTGLADHVVRNLPVLFTAGELQHQVAPLLTADRIRLSLMRIKDQRYQGDDLSQAGLLSADPLGLRHLVLARLDACNPQQKAGPLGRLLSADRRHLLVRAMSKESGLDPAAARRLSQFFRDLTADLVREYGSGVGLTVAGAYRATLDNAASVKQGLNRALIGAAAGLGGLLMAAFSQLLAGFLALLPALGGTIMALFVFALIRDSVSIMVLGCGGAIIFITAYPGIACLLWMNSDRNGGGRPASKDIRGIGLPAVFIAMAAFGTLAFSGASFFEQLGLFTAMGIGFAFLFAYAIFPRILREPFAQTPILRRRFSGWMDRLAAGGLPGIILTLLAAAALAACMHSRFAADPKTRPGVSQATRNAEALMADVWEDIFSSTYVMAAADNLEALQSRNDRLLELLDTEANAGGIAGTATPSLFFPGRERCAQNGAAWKAFWSRERVQAVSQAVMQEGAALGYTGRTFSPFLDMLAAEPPAETSIPSNVMPLLGIAQRATGGWCQTIRIKPRTHFDRPRLSTRLAPYAIVTDSASASQCMDNQPPATFTKSLPILGASLIALLVVFLADFGLIVTALLPPFFAAIGTLGTLGIMGWPLDIPAALLAVIIPGIGVSGTVFLIRGCQRGGRCVDPRVTAAGTAVFMATGPMLVGAAGLLTSRNGLLISAGWLALLGIGACLAGTLLILPPILKRRFEGDTDSHRGVERRYRNLEPWPRMVARFQLRLDSLCDELADLAPEEKSVANILDVGCGYGVPACWMAERHPQAVIHGIDPRRERVRVAALALGDRGRIDTGSAPDLPSMDVLLDLATLLDMSHYLQDWELEKTLERIHERLLPGGRLIMRSVLPKAGHHRIWHLERLKTKGPHTCYRDAKALDGMLDQCGFDVLTCRHSGTRRGLVWHVAKPR